MEGIPYVAHLFVYPIKSLDGVEVEQVRVGSQGGLQHDRAWALFDAAGQVVNGKRYAQIQTLRAEFDLATPAVRIGIPDHPHQSFHLHREPEALAAYVSGFFGFPLTLGYNDAGGFPDDTDSPGPTVISTATLETVASWYGLPVENVRRRFRSNIEIAGVPPFWEDRLFTTAAATVPFQVGEVAFLGVNPCQRCVVITRDPETGAVTPDFQKVFVTQRQEHLPPWADRTRFHHFFRLAINTRVAGGPSHEWILRRGDPVNLL